MSGVFGDDFADAVKGLANLETASRTNHGKGDQLFLGGIGTGDYFCTNPLCRQFFPCDPYKREAVVAEVMTAIDELVEHSHVQLCVAEFVDYDSTKEMIKRVGFLDNKGSFHYIQSREINGSWTAGMQRTVSARWLDKVMPLSMAIRQIIK